MTTTEIEETVREGRNKTIENGLRRGFYTQVDDYMVGTAFLLMAVLGVVLNILTIIIIKRGKHSSKEIRIQLINLAIVDGLSALFFPATSMVTVLMISFPESTALCKITRFIGYGALYTSPLWNVAISLERFTAVFFPLKMINYSKNYKLAVAGLVGVCGFLPEIDSLLHAQIVTWNRMRICTTNSPLAQKNPVLFDILIVLKYVLPALIIVVVYTAIAIRLMLRKRIGERDGSRRQKQGASKEKKQVILNIV